MKEDGFWKVVDENWIDQSDIITQIIYDYQNAVVQGDIK